MAGSAVPRRIFGFSWLVLAATLAFLPSSFALSPKSNSAEQREITVAFLRDWPPQYAIDDKSKPTGFARDAMDAIARIAGYRVRYHIVDSYEEAFKDIREGRADVIPNVGIIPERRQIGIFTVPVETFAVSIFVRSVATQIKRIDDLRGRRIGVVHLNAGVSLVSTIESAVPVVHQDARSALSDLVSGQIDAVIFPEPVFMSLARKLNLEDKIETLGQPLREVKRGILVRKGEAALWRTLDQSVQDFVGTPTYDRIYAAWYGESDPFWTVPRVAWAMGAFVVFGLLASFGWQYHLVARLNGRLTQQATVLHTVLDNMDQGISLFDENLESVAFNDRFLQLLEVPPPENQVGVSLECFIRVIAGRLGIDSDKRDEYVQKYLVAAKKFEPIHFVRQKPDGTTIDIRRNPTPGGGFVTTYTDITERMRVENALRISEQQLSEAQRIGRIGHWRYLPHNHQFECSDAFYQIYGWNFGKFKPSYAAITEAVHPEDRERMKAVRKDAGRRKTSYTAEFRIIHFDGSVRVIRGEGRPEFDESGRLISFFGVNQDITEQKRTEEELLRERTRAELANRAKSEFLANMSHEIRTPLNAIIGFADIMEQRVFGTIGNDRYAEYVTDIHASARHLLELVNDILDISTIEAGELSLSPVALDLGTIFQECTRLVSEQARIAEVMVSTNTASDMVTVYADRRAIRQILLNLLSNAIKFTPPGGNITIGAEFTDETISIIVRDTGVGIPEEELPKITQPFETGSNNPHTLKKGNPYIRPEGTGLGLAIVRSLAKLHGGDLDIESSAGEGTCVRVWFPRSRRAAAA